MSNNLFANQCKLYGVHSRKEILIKETTIIYIIYYNIIGSGTLQMSSGKFIHFIRNNYFGGAFTEGQG